MTAEELFSKFVAFLFPNEKLDEDVIEAVKSNQVKKYLADHGFLEYNTKFAVYDLQTIFKEMGREDPDEEIIDDCLESVMEILGTWASPNLEGLKFFRQFDIESRE